MNSWELQEEKEIAKLFGRPMRTFIRDIPFYPGIPPEPLVNFDLNFKN